MVFFNLLDGGILVRCCTSVILLGDLPVLQFRDDFLRLNSVDPIGFSVCKWLERSESSRVFHDPGLIENRIIEKVQWSPNYTSQKQPLPSRNTPGVDHQARAGALGVLGLRLLRHFFARQQRSKRHNGGYEGGGSRVHGEGYTIRNSLSFLFIKWCETVSDVKTLVGLKTWYGDYNRQRFGIPSFPKQLQWGVTRFFSCTC